MACGGCGSTQTYTLQFLNKQQHNADTYSFDFAALERMAWKEGDSAKVYMAMDGDLEGKKFSFVTMPEEKVVRFTTRIRQERSNYKDRWDSLVPGDFVEVSSPGGQFSLRRGDRPALLLSNGVGIAAMRTLIKAFAKDSSGVHRLTQINVDSRHHLYEDEFGALAEEVSGFKSFYKDHREDFYPVVDFEAQNLMLATGYVPYFYVVGSDSFVLDVTAYLMRVGFDEADIITDGSSAGGCGGGGCGGCGSGGCS